MLCKLGMYSNVIQCACIVCYCTFLQDTESCTVRSLLSMVVCIRSSLISPGGSVVRNPPARQEPQEIGVQSLGQEDSLEEDMKPHSSILTWKTPWTEEPGRLQSIGLQRVRQGHD